jgi:hypothetical protein
MKRKIYLLLVSAIISSLIISGCKLAGLDLQKDAPFDASIRDSKINMNALEFMKSRTDLFSSMIEAVTYAGLAEEYTKPDRTFLFLTNRALSDETYFPTPPAVMGSYFGCNKVLNPAYSPTDPTKGPQYLTPDSWNVYPVETVKQFLLYHIVKENVSFRNAKAFPAFYESVAYKAAGDTTKVNIYLVNDRNATMRINGFTGSRKVDLAPRTSGIDCTNGVIHVLDDFIIPPTRLILGIK